MATSTIAQLAPQVSERLQDPTNIFWNLNFEIYGGLAEAISELLLIIGRPTQIFNTPFSPVVNTVWQALPQNMLAITDVRSTSSRIQKTTLRSLDYLCASWTSSWESDRGPTPLRWAPVGLNMFVLHPAPLQPIQLNVTGIEYPFTDTWPPNGTETSPFHKEVNQALQLYATAYCRTKEIGNDAEVGWQLYQQFLEIAQRLSVIEDRRDSVIWTKSLGGPTAPSGVSHR